MPWSKMLFGGEWRKGWCDVDPKNRFLLLGVLTSVPILVTVDQKIRSRVHTARLSTCQSTG